MQFFSTTNRNPLALAILCLALCASLGGCNTDDGDGGAAGMGGAGGEAGTGGGGGTPCSAAPPIINPETLPDGQMGVPYEQALDIGVMDGVTWSISDGALPSGIELNESTGLLSGTTDDAGLHTFTVSVGLNNPPEGCTFPPASREYVLFIGVDEEQIVEIEVAGIWSDNFGGWTVIDSELWGLQTVHEFDNDADWAITQNPADAEYNPSKYNYVVWSGSSQDDAWWTCTVAYGIETLEEALATENTSDASDPENGGCGDFSWTQMTPRNAIEVTGNWDDNFGGQTSITPTTWGNQRIHAYDNDDNWAATQMPADDEFNPSMYNYVVWTEIAEESIWWTCTVAYGLETLEDALAVENTSDASDPANGGCGDFSWTQMSPGAW